MSIENLPAINDEFCLKEFGWTKSQYEVVQRTYFKGLSFDEIKIFGHVCKHTGLDPFLKQIYPVVRSGKMVIQTAIDGYRLIAERTGRYSPGRESTFVYKNDGSIVSATSYVKKMTDDGTWHEVASTAYFDEYNPGVGPFWKKMPHTMIAKCAEALALRKAFPAELSAIRSEDEMDQARPDISHIKETQYEDVSPKMPENKVSTTMSAEEIAYITPEQVIELDRLFIHTNDKYKEMLRQELVKRYGSSDFNKVHETGYEFIVESMKRNIEMLAMKVA